MAITISIFCSRFFTVIFDFGNVYFDWWFQLVNILLIIPMLVAVIFFVMWFFNDTKESRKSLWIGCILFIASVVLLCLWAIIYITTFY